MPRLASLAPVLALAVLACNKSEQGGRVVEQPSGAGAGGESTRAGKSNSNTASESTELAHRFVAVAATAPAEAEPCERTCGRVGDCLLETRDVDEFEAARLELECLDLCVHSPDDAKPRTAFLACEQQSACGEVLGCARSNWDALVAAHVRPAFVDTTVSSGSDRCIDGCYWLFSCVLTGAPPDAGRWSTTEYENYIRECAKNCESATEQERAMWVYFAECMQTHCSMHGYESCLSNQPLY